MKFLHIFLLISILLLSFLLHFYKISSIPPGLYMDEASIGVNAYSILKTGKDEYGVKLPLWFQSLGDYKLPLYPYITVASIFIFGKNEFAVRFPSAFFGTITVLVIFFFAKEFLKKRWALLTSFVFTVTPWHLQLSRAGVETNLGLSFFTIGITFGVLFIKNRKLLFFVLSSMFLVFSMYTYNTYRIISPVVFFVMLLNVILVSEAHPESEKDSGASANRRIPRMTNYPKLNFGQLKLLIVVPLFIITCIPMFQFSLTKEGLARFAQTSAFWNFKDISFINKLLTYPILYLRNYLTYFATPFLFNSGDGIARHQMIGFGTLLRWQIPFVLLGIYGLLKSKNKIAKTVIAAITLISPLSAAFTLPSPHTTRSFPLIIPVSLIITYGMGYFLKISSYVIPNLFRDPLKILERISRVNPGMPKRVRHDKRPIIVSFILLLIFVFEFSFYLHNYYFHYPKTSLLDWGGAYKELVGKVSTYRDKYSVIVVSKQLKFAYVYFLFYNEEIKAVYPKSSYEENQIYKDNKGSALYITSDIDEKTAKPSEKLLGIIRLPNPNKDIFAMLWEI